MNHAPRRIITRSATSAALVALALLTGSFDARAYSVPGSEDAYVRHGRQAEKNFGDGATVKLRASGGGSHGYVKFDLSELPATATGAMVSRAMLHIPLARVRKAGRIDVVQVDGPWSEATVTAANAPPAGAVLGRVSVEKSGSNRTVRLDVTGLVRGWLNGSVANHGIALLPGDGARVDIHSRERPGSRGAIRMDLLLLGSAPALAPGYGGVATVASFGGDYADPREAMAHLVDGDGWCGFPSATNRCLIRIMPGTYDLGDARDGSALSMRPFVSIEGAGQAATVLTAGGTDSLPGYPATVRTARDAELRNLTVESTGGAVYANAVRGVANHRLVDVTAIARGATGSNRAIVNQNTGDARPVLRNVTAIAVADDASATGISNSCSGTDIDGAVIRASATGHGSAAAIADSSDPGPCGVTVAPHIANVRGVAEGGSRAIAFAASQSHALLRNVVLVARDASLESHAVTVGSLSDLRIQNSRLEASGSPVTIGIDGFGGGTVQVDHSVIDAPTATLNLGGAPAAVSIGGTRLGGGPIVSTVPVACAAVYDGENRFYPDSCP